MTSPDSDVAAGRAVDPRATNEHPDADGQPPLHEEI